MNYFFTLNPRAGKIAHGLFTVPFIEGYQLISKIVLEKITHCCFNKYLRENNFLKSLKKTTFFLIERNSSTDFEKTVDTTVVYWVNTKYRLLLF